MTGTGQGREPGGPREPRESDGWQILSYMIGGMALYGFIGWLIGRWTGLSFLFPVGMIAGLAFSIVLIIFRVTRP
jgi:ATP synthase protein I